MFVGLTKLSEYQSGLSYARYLGTMEATMFFVHSVNGKLAVRLAEIPSAAYRASLAKRGRSDIYFLYNQFKTRLSWRKRLRNLKRIRFKRRLYSFFNTYFYSPARKFLRYCLHHFSPIRRASPFHVIGALMLFSQIRKELTGSILFANSEIKLT